MADPFSTAAAAIGLADVAIKSAREISNFITSLKDASETLRQTQEVVCEVQRLLEDLQHLENTYRKSSMAHINPQSLSSIRRAVKSINEDLSCLRVKIDEPIFSTDSLSRRFLKSLRIRNKERSIIKICSRLEQRVLFTHTTLSVLGRNDDLVQIGALATVTENTQLVLHNQTQLRHDTLGSLQCSAAAFQQIHREQQRFRFDILNEQTQLRADILDSINTSHANHRAPVLLHEGSANDAAEILSSVRRLLPSVLAKTTLPGTSMKDLTWVEKEVGKILLSVHMLAASELQGSQIVVPCGSRRTTQEIAVQALHFLTSQSAPDMMQGNRNKRWVKMISRNLNEEMELVVSLPQGNLSIWITESCHIDAGGLSYNLKGFRILFAPNGSRLLPGLSASYFDSSEGFLKIPSAVRTFGIVPPESDILDRICNGDIEEVRGILERGECSAADRDMDGHSLLLHAIYSNKYDMCRLLLRSGADALDCTKYGRTALHFFLNCWDPDDSEVPYADFIRLFETSGCFDCDHVTNTFNFTGEFYGSYLQPASFSACNSVLVDKTVNDDQLRALVTRVLDINETQFTGETLLMYSTNTKFSNMIRLANELLRVGADVRPATETGQDVLFFFCYRLSSCSASIPFGIEQEDMVLLLQELITRGALVQKTTHWHSPTEMALTPAAWVLWCQALDGAGIDIETLLREEDEFSGCQSPSSEDMQELVGDVTGPKTVNPEILLDVRPQETCRVCGGGVGPVYYRPPFDHHCCFLTAPTMKHSVAPRHENGLLCRNFIHGGSCGEDGHVSMIPWFSYQSLSIRKWAALWLWRNGWLPTPEDAEYWATDVITEEALDSFGYLSAIRL